MVATYRAVAAPLLVVVFCAGGSPLFGQTPSGSESALAGSVEGSIRFPVHRAREIALMKLRGSRCQQLFSEFEDSDGRALDRVLVEADETAAGHLSRLSFLDGSRKPTCGRGGVYAFTSPGSQTVYVCPAFRLLAREDGKTAANILIHEELHSLGAGEAPMPGLLSTKEITERVELRCGR